MNRRTFVVFAVVGVLASLASAARAAEPRTEPRPKPPANPAMQPVQDVAGLPRVLLIGDSISIGYTVGVREALKGKANVHRALTNCGPTKNGVANLDKWLGDGKWDVIHFNFGIHDLKHMPDGKRQVEPADYEQNLRTIVARLRKTKARLIFATTTPIPAGELQPKRTFGDVGEYNQIARKVMKDNDVAVNDLNAAITPKLADMQQPKDVHFKPAGSQFLAEKVAEAIRAAL